MAKDRLLQVRISDIEIKMLERISEDKLMTKSQMVRSLILDQYKKLDNTN